MTAGFGGGTLLLGFAFPMPSRRTDSALTRTEVVQAFEGLRVWTQGSRSAVYKPLLVLFALGRLARGEAPRMEFAAIEKEFGELLQDFGPPDAKGSRHYPFWHLRSDRVWELSGPKELLARPAGATPTIGELRELHVSGSFTAAVQAALRADPSLVAEIARRVMDAHFPETLREDVLDAVGIVAEPADGGADPSGGRRRDPRFREAVLRAYEYRCCVCGYDLRLRNQPIGLEAAHVQWFQAGGPDVVQNGLALCSLHHKIFDLGAFTVLPESLEIVFSQHMVGSREQQERLLASHRSRLTAPQSHDSSVGVDFLKWHANEVFKGPHRD